MQLCASLQSVAAQGLHIVPGVSDLQAVRVKYSVLEFAQQCWFTRSNGVCIQQFALHAEGLHLLYAGLKTLPALGIVDALEPSGLLEQLGTACFARQFAVSCHGTLQQA